MKRNLTREGIKTEHKWWSSTPTSTRDEISKENRKQADCITGDRAGAASRFLLCQLQPLADPSIQLLSPKTCVWERLCGRSLGSLSCTALSPWSIIEEKSLGFTQLKQGAASIIASIFFQSCRVSSRQSNGGSSGNQLPKLLSQNQHYLPTLQ